MRPFVQCNCALSLASFVILAITLEAPEPTVKKLPTQPYFEFSFITCLVYNQFSWRWGLKWFLLYCACALLVPSQSVSLGGHLFGLAVFESGAGSQTVSLPITSVLAIMAATLGAGVHPHWLSCWNDLAAWRIYVAVWTWRRKNEVRWASSVDRTTHSQQSTSHYFSSKWPN